MNVNLEKAYIEDLSIRKFIDLEIINLQTAVENIYYQLVDCDNQEIIEINVTGSLISITEVNIYPELENWQKALGDFLICLSANIMYDQKTKKAIAQITLNSIDMYNFNKDAADIFTGLPDNANGRFVVLGWAKSFVTKGRYLKYVMWDFHE